MQPCTASVTSAKHSGKLNLVEKSILELTYLVDDASDFIVRYEGKDKGGMTAFTLLHRIKSHRDETIVSPGRFLKATSAQENVQEFSSILDRITKDLERALHAEVYVRVVNADERKECAEISNWLTSLDFVGRLHDIMAHHATGTGSWFSERDNMQDWMHDRSELRKLWFTGPRKSFQSIVHLL